MPGIADPFLSRAVLIGTGRYETLSQISAIHNNLTALAEVLTADRFWGLPADRCVVVEDPETTPDMLDPVVAAAQDATDTLLLYYAGHGLVDPRRSELYLALSASDPTRIYTAVPYAHVRDVLLDSRAVRRIVILDCCYSGRALGQMATSASTVADEASAEGTFILAASAENKTALAPPGEVYTAFTGELLSIIRNGIAGRGPVLDLDTIYQHVLASMRSRGRPLPQKRDRNTAGQLPLIHNQAHQRPITTVLATGAAATVPPRDSKSESSGHSARAVPPVPQVSRSEKRVGTVPVTAEWALQGKTPGGRGYQLLGYSEGVIDPKNFEEAQIRYSPGTLKDLPQVTVSWLDPSGRCYVAIAIHDYGEEHMFDADGRDIVFTSYFCIPYDDAAEYVISYQAMYDTFREIPLLSATGRSPFSVELALLARPSHIEIEQASRVAALLLTCRPVCIVGADRVSIPDRLRFIDMVMSLLPYGLRSHMSGSTWSSSTYHEHKFRLFFSNAPRPAWESGSSHHVVSWHHLDNDPIGHGYADEYLNWLRNEREPAVPLANYTVPMSFRQGDILTALEFMGVPLPAHRVYSEMVSMPPTSQGNSAPGRVTSMSYRSNFRTTDDDTANPAARSHAVAEELSRSEDASLSGSDSGSHALAIDEPQFGKHEVPPNTFQLESIMPEPSASSVQAPEPTVSRLTAADNMAENSRNAAAQRRTSRQLTSIKRAGYLAAENRLIPNSHAIIDHLVVGPAGVFAIDSEVWDKHLVVRTKKGTQLWHGPFSKRERLDNARSVAQQASDLLSAALGIPVIVRPAIAIYGPKLPWDIATVRDVDVFSGSALRQYLRHHARTSGNPRLIVEQIKAITDAAVKVLPGIPPPRNHYISARHWLSWLILALVVIAAVIIVAIQLVSSGGS
jgi:Caspase domain/Nuclease-related domain